MRIVSLSRGCLSHLPHTPLRRRAKMMHVHSQTILDQSQASPQFVQPLVWPNRISSTPAIGCPPILVLTKQLLHVLCSAGKMFLTFPKLRPAFSSSHAPSLRVLGISRVRKRLGHGPVAEAWCKGNLGGPHFRR